MRHLELFDQGKGNCWKVFVSNSKNFDVYLHKVGVRNESDIKLFNDVRTILKNTANQKYFFIVLDSDGEWSFTYDLLHVPSYKYHGIIKITYNDINEYKIFKSTLKYNL